MARMHARRKGKSGSHRPVDVDLSFVKYKEKEVVDLILKLVEDDVKPSKIGIVLRDSHGIHSVKKITGKSINKILEENNKGLSVPEDLTNLVEKAKGLKKHLEKNSRDVHNKRGLKLIESRIRRLVKYYKSNNKLPEGWSYK